MCLGVLAAKEISLCNSVVLCVSVVKLPRKTFTTEAQRLHREPQRHFCPVRLGAWASVDTLAYVSVIANARTGNVPKPFTFTGTAKNLKLPGAEPLAVASGSL